MKAWKYLLPLLASAAPIWAQVERVAMRTTGISCGTCAVVSEFHFRRMQGIDQVHISRSQEAIMLTYKPGAVFSTQAIRDVLQPLNVGVVQFQINARGQVRQLSGKSFFVAGRDKFLLVGDAALSVPRDMPIVIEGILKDQVTPMELKILNFTPAK
jgi:hypothetical protein